jgi:hypothetical protein
MTTDKERLKNICPVCFAYMLDMQTRHLIKDKFKKCPSCGFTKKVEPMLLTIDDLLMHKYKLEDLPQEHQDNLKILLERVNKMILDYGKPLTVTSGYRSLEDHLKIYEKKGITDKSKIPMGSRHLSGCAVDLYDDGLVVTHWLKEDECRRANQYDLYFEDGNSNWVHAQIIKPKSGNKFFKP